MQPLSHPLLRILLPQSSKIDLQNVSKTRSRSLLNKIKQFHSFVYSSPHQIFAVTESWCTPDVYNNELFPPHISVYSKDRSTTGGGVLIGIHSSIPSRQLQSLELVCVEVSFSISFICLVYVCMYPLSNYDYMSSLATFLTSLAPQPVILLGDFNLPDINWNSLSGSTPTSTLFCDLVFDMNLDKLVTFHTHCKGNILDLCLTNQPT